MSVRLNDTQWDKLRGLREIVRYPLGPDWVYERLRLKAVESGDYQKAGGDKYRAVELVLLYAREKKGLL